MIGLIEAFNEGLTWYTPGSDWTRSMVFGILIPILVFRPEGLLGERTPEGAMNLPKRKTSSAWTADAVAGLGGWERLPEPLRRAGFRLS